MFSNLKTFEYDLALAGNNLQYMSRILADIWPTSGPIKTQATTDSLINWSGKNDLEKSEKAAWLLARVEARKGEFAQTLAFELSKDSTGFAVPDYIKNAVLWII